jgi:hypothetical protein
MRGIKGLVGIAVLAASLFCMSGCSLVMKTNYVYKDGDKYTAGNREITDKIDTIDIDYMSGQIDLVGSADEKVNITETSEKQLDDKRKVHTWVEGSTLHVRYCASAKKLDLNKLNKKLEITVPKSIKYSNVQIKASSADMNVGGFSSENVRIHASSGDVTASVEAENIKIDVSSGDVNLNQTGNSSDIILSASSGDIKADMDTVDKLDVSASSGKLKLNARKIKELNTITSSGSNEFRFSEVPEKSDITASSGDVTMYLPEELDLTADISVSSGKLFYEQKFSKDGKTYVCGNGSNKMKINTSSGDIDIKALSKND